MSIEERVAEILIDHFLIRQGITECECYCREAFNDEDGYPEDRWAAHVAQVLTTELELAQEFVARHESGGGYIRNTQTEAEQDLLHYRPPGVEDPGSGRCTHIEARYVTPWENA